MTTLSTLRRVPTRVGAIAIADEGSGTPVVLWPSLFSDHRLYAALVPLLGDRWRTIGIDGPGFGRSDAPRGEVQADVYADVVLECLDALGLERAFIAGCSWGGQIAVHLGVKAPARVRGVLIMNAPLGPSLGGHAFEVWGTRWFGATAYWGNGVARSMFSSASQKTHPERVRAFVSAFTNFESTAAAVTARTVLTRFPGLGGVLPRLAVPATFLMGAEDRLYPVEQMRPFAALAPNAKLVVIPSCGHLAPLEAPEVVAEALEDLLAHASSGSTKW